MTSAMTGSACISGVFGCTNHRLLEPPKRSNALDNEAPKSIYTSDGEEVTTETEYGSELVIKHWYEEHR